MMSTELEIDPSKYQNLGRLHLVKSSKKEFPCRECGNVIPVGSQSFRQHVYPGGRTAFPIDSRVCDNCSKPMIQIGIEIVDHSKKKEKVIENKQGICSNCGDDTDYLDQWDVCAGCRNLQDVEVEDGN